MEDRISLSDYIIVLKKYKKMIIIWSVISMLIGLIISLVIPPEFTATASIFPPNMANNAQNILGINTPSLDKFSMMLQSTGIGNIQTLNSQLSVEILTSVPILNRIIEKFNLKLYFHENTITETRLALLNHIKTDISESGIVSLSVRLKDKNLAAEIANSFFEELDKLLRKVNISTGRKYRIFVGKRLKDESKVLNTAENELIKFQKKHKIVEVDEELKKIIDVYADLKANLIEKEIQKNAYKKISPTNPYTQYLEDEIRGIKREIERMESEKSSSGWGAGFGTPFNQIPDVYAELANLMKNVEIHQAIYEFLLQQYEQAKIQEAKDTPTVQFLSRATPPEKRSWPKRKLILLLALLLGLILSTLGAFFSNSIKNEK